MTVLSDEDRRAYQANIWKSYLLHFLMHFQLWWAIWVLYLQDLRGFSLTQIGVLEALFWGTATLAEVPTGAIADRFGRKTSLTLGACSTAIAVLIFGLAESYWVVLVSYLWWAFAAAFLSGAEHALLFESLKAQGKPEEYQRVAGRFGAVFSFASLAGGLAGAPIAAATNLSVPVVLSAAIAAPGVLVALSLREPALSEGEVRLGYGPLLRESARTATRLPAVRGMLLLSSLIAAFTFGPHLFMQPFLSGHDVGVGIMGVVLTPVRMAGIAGALVAAWAITRLGTRSAFLTAPAVLAGSYVLLGVWDSVFAFSGFLLVSFMSHMLAPAATDYLNRRIASNQRATILSLRTMLISLWAAALVPAMGATADTASLQAMFVGAAVAGGVLSGGALMLWLGADRREGEELSPAAEEPLPAG